MNTNFNPGRVIQTHLQENPAHPINGPKHWAVYGRNLNKDGTAVLLGTGPTIGDATSAAARKVSEDYPGFTI